MPGDAPIVVDSAGCGAAMKDYGRLLGTPRPRAFSARVRDFSEWLAAQPPLRAPRHRHAWSWCRTRATCATCSTRTARCARVLGPAYALLETDDDGLCCGAGGAYAVLEPELASDIRTARSHAHPRPRRGDRRAARRRRPTPAARCTSAPPASTSAIPPSCSPRHCERRRTRWLTPTPSSSGCARSRRTSATSPTSASRAAAEDGDAERRRRREAAPAGPPRHRARHQRARRAKAAPRID